MKDKQYSNLEYPNSPEMNSSNGSDEARTKVFLAYRKGCNNLNKTYTILKGKTPVQWEMEAFAQWLGVESPELSILDEDVYIQFLNFTKTNIRQLLSNFASQGVKYHISAENKNYKFKSQKMADIGNAILKYYLEKCDDESDFLSSSQEAITVGTCFEFNTFDIDVKKNKVVDHHDPVSKKTSTIEEDQIIYSGLKSKIIAIDDFLFDSSFVPIQEQPFVIMRQKIPYSTFKYKFGKLAGANEVLEGEYTFSDKAEENLFTKDFDVKGDEVQLIHYYDKYNNSYILMANGIVLINSVNPFKHGQYPVSRKVFGELSGKFFMYGDHFPNLIGGEQGLVNYLWTLMSHHQKWASTPFIVTRDGAFGMDEDGIEAMTPVKVRDMEDFRVEKVQDVGNGAMSMIGKLQEFIRDFSGNLSGGSDLFTPAGGKVQATQLMMAQEHAQKSAGFSMVYIEKGERDKKDQQFSNARQFVSLPEMYAITGGSLNGIYDFKYPSIAVDDVEFSDSKEKGRMIIQMMDTNTPGMDREALREEIQVLQEINYENGLKNVKVSVVDPKMFDTVEYSITVQKFSSHTKNQALEIEKRNLAYTRSLEAMQMGIRDDINLSKIWEWSMEPYNIDRDILLSPPEESHKQISQPQTQEGVQDPNGAGLAQKMQQPIA